MKITVLNGSPKGDMSVTLQSVHFIRKTFPAHEFQICNISSKIRIIESNKDGFLKVVEGIGSSDAVLWAFPLYFFLVPAQYKRFVELVFERGAPRGLPRQIRGRSVDLLEIFRSRGPQLHPRDLRRPGDEIRGFFLHGHVRSSRSAGKAKAGPVRGNPVRGLRNKNDTRKGLPAASPPGLSLHAKRGHGQDRQPGKEGPAAGRFDYRSAQPPGNDRKVLVRVRPKTGPYRSRRHRHEKRLPGLHPVRVRQRMLPGRRFHGVFQAKGRRRGHHRLRGVGQGQVFVLGLEDVPGQELFHEPHACLAGQAVRRTLLRTFEPHGEPSRDSVRLCGMAGNEPGGFRFRRTRRPRPYRPGVAVPWPKDWSAIPDSITHGLPRFWEWAA